MLRRSAAALVAGVPGVLLSGVLLSACGLDIEQDDDVEPQADTVRAGLVQLYAVDDGGPEVVEEGECFADALLARLSLEELVQAGIVEDDGTVTDAIPMLDVDVAEAWVTAQDSCVAFAVPPTREVVARGADDAAAERFAACLGARVTAAEAHTALVRALSGGIDSPETTALLAAQAGCADRALRS